MKKNVMMRVASIMLVLVLMSSSVISGTFAKYVTSDNVGDTARVAKWGVTVATRGTLFSKSYLQASQSNVPGTGAGVTVENISSDGKNLVAPGTQNLEGMSFTLTGTPEVDVNVQIDFTANKEVFLAAGTYVDPTNGSATPGNFTIGTEGYYPVVFTLWGVKTTGGVDTKTALITGNVAAIQAWLDTELNKDYDSNTNLAQIVEADFTGTYYLTWAWAYGEFDGVTNNDRADTYLGNLAAADPTADNVNMDVNFKITVTQID